MNTAFDAEALFAKSKVFVERGLIARDASDFGLFHTWAALSLEILGKSVLAHIHPVLVADPRRFQHLLAACGKLDTDDVRSIMAKTVYERLRTLSTQYDKRSEDFCMLMANRRNGELHSGSSPTTDLPPDAWVPDFWRVSQIILNVRGATLDDWVGEVEASSAAKLIADATKLLEETVAARIRRHAAEFERRYPQGSLERRHAVDGATSAYWPTAMREQTRQYDSHDKHECSACHCQGWLFGYELGQHRTEPEYDAENGWVQLVDTEYGSEAFVCPVCDLRVTGRQELDFAGFPETFARTEPAEPDYEPDYGND